MSSILPRRPAIEHTPRDRSVLDIAAKPADVVFEALGSETARTILAALRDDPATASDLADRVDTSLQNVQYHVDKLRDAGLVASVGTWYSSKGTEMTVYAPTVARLEIPLQVPSDSSADGGATPVTVSASAADD